MLVEADEMESSISYLVPPTGQFMSTWSEIRARGNPLLHNLLRTAC